MKKLLVLILLVLIAGVWVAGKMTLDAGYLLIAYQDTSIEMSLWVGLLLIVVAVILVYILVWLIGKLLTSGDTARRWKHNFGHKRSLSKTNAGVTAYLEGNWAEAQKKFEQAAAKSDTPLLAYLAATQAAAKNEDYPACEVYLRKANHVAPGMNTAIEMAKLDVQIQRKQYEQALATILRLRKEQPKHKYLCKRLQEVYVALEDWEALSQLMPVMRKLKVAPLAELDEIEKKTALFQLERAAKGQSESGKTQTQAARVVMVWNQIPSKVRRDELITLAYTQHLTKLGKAELAVQALIESINHHWSEKLVEQFGLVQGEDIKHQLLTAERWLQERNNSSVLMLALGRLSLRNKLWGKAREYFISSIKLRNSVEACAELGRLLGCLGDEQGSSRYLQQSVELTRQNLPQLPMPSKQTPLSQGVG